MSDTNERSDAVEIARMNLNRAIHTLPYSGALLSYTPLLNSDETEPEFLAQITAWIYRFADVLQSVSETTTSMADELHELRSQKQAVRDFLGLTTAEKGNPA